jgi:hypothetical protein
VTSQFRSELSGLDDPRSSPPWHQIGLGDPLVLDLLICISSDWLVVPGFRKLVDDLSQPRYCKLVNVCTHHHQHSPLKTY